MQKKTKKYLIITVGLFLIVILFTVMIKTIDVRPIGPNQSAVGLAAINQFVFERFGVNMIWYDITEWLGVAAIIIAAGFAVLGLSQIIKRKSIKKVDSRILLLGVFYLLVIAVYVFFEVVIVNYRPVILSEGLEASFPSSHTMTVICIIVTAMLQFHYYLRRKKVWLWITDVVSISIIEVTVVGRLLSGVHWFTDIVAGVLISLALIALYCLALTFTDGNYRRE